MWGQKNCGPQNYLHPRACWQAEEILGLGEGSLTLCQMRHLQSSDGGAFETVERFIG
jgi:hypothetical protein